MDDARLVRFFLEPSSARQRQYEALRAVFVEGLSQKAAAERFGYSYDALRQLVHEFRLSFSDGPVPPFSTDPTAADPRPTLAGRSPTIPTPRPSPTRE